FQLGRGAIGRAPIRWGRDGSRRLWQGRVNVLLTLSASRGTMGPERRRATESDGGTPPPQVTGERERQRQGPRVRSDDALAAGPLGRNRTWGRATKRNDPRLGGTAGQSATGA